MAIDRHRLQMLISLCLVSLSWWTIFLGIYMLTSVNSLLLFALASFSFLFYTIIVMVDIKGRPGDG
jgi:hypothetical protein